MRKIAFLVLITLLFFPSFIIAQTQFELNQSAGEELEKAEAELNEVYQQILKLYNDEKEFLEKLKLSQEAWLKFRDAHLEALYPVEDKRGAYGSVFPMCYAYAKASITSARTEQLKVWLNGTEEGDVCSGSVKWNHVLKELINDKKHN